MKEIILLAAEFVEGPASVFDIRLLWTIGAILAALPLFGLLVWRCVVGLRQRIADNDREAVAYAARAANSELESTPDEPTETESQTQKAKTE